MISLFHILFTVCEDKKSESQSEEVIDTEVKGDRQDDVADPQDKPAHKNCVNIAETRDSSE